MSSPLYEFRAGIANLVWQCDSARARGNGAPILGAVTDMVPVPPPGRADPTLLAELRELDLVVRDELAKAGLPGEGLFTDVGERHAMLAAMSATLAGLDEETLAHSQYISKMIAAAAVGLFDAALNYLWDELVDELRRRVLRHGVDAFYDAVAGTGRFRGHLRDESDLIKVDDIDLVRGLRALGALSEAEFRRLDHIRFMRNHASAAHPNQVAITGMELANWLQAGLEVITRRS